MKGKKSSGNALLTIGFATAKLDALCLFKVLFLVRRLLTL